MTTKFFVSHDFNARNDEKILMLRQDLGLEGYGIYWAFIESLAEHDGYIEEKNLKGISFSIGAAWETFEKFFCICIDQSLLKLEDGKVYSDSLNKRLDYKRSVSDKRSKAGKLGAKAKQDKANAKQVISKSQANAKQNQANQNQNLNQNLNLNQEISTEVDIVSKLTAQDQFKNEINNLFPSIDGFKVQDARDFYDYWTEPDKKGKMLKDKQKTWDTSRRMKRWINNKNDNSNLQNKSKSFAEQEYDFKKDKVRENIEWIKEMQQARTLNMYEGDEVGKIG